MNKHISESRCLQTAVDFIITLKFATFHNISNYRPGTRSRSRSTPRWLWPASGLCPATPSTRVIDSSTRPLRCLALLFVWSWFVFNELHCRWCLLRLASKNSNLWAVSTSLAWRRAPCPPHLVPWPNLDSTFTLPVLTGQYSVRYSSSEPLETRCNLTDHGHSVPWLKTKFSEIFLLSAAQQQSLTVNLLFF